MNATTPAPLAPSGVVPRRLLSDERLARLAAGGDSSAFSTIFERFHQEIYRYCRAILSDHDEAQDALQNTMAAALRSLPGEEREIALRPWLYRIAHNQAISIVRHRPDPPPGTEGVATSAPSAQAGAEERERLRELVRDLSALPDRQRGALVMRELSGLSYAEIASALDSGEPAARQTVYEAREAMRDSKRGREMDCSAVRAAISGRDGRILRGRALRAHLRTCEGCRDFRVAISTRSRDLQLLSPPLSAVAATSLLGAVLGHGAGVGGAGAAGAGAAATAVGAGGSAAMLAKGGAVIAALAVGAGAAGATGAIDLPFSGSNDEAASTPTEGAGAATAAHEHSHGAGTKGSADSAADGSGKDAGAKGEGKDSAHAHSQGVSHSQAGQAGEHGNGTPALGAGADHQLPPNSQGSSPPGNAVGNPHTSSSSPSSTTPPRSESGAEHSNAGTTGPPESSNAGGNGGNPHG